MTDWVKLRFGTRIALAALWVLRAAGVKSVSRFAPSARNSYLTLTDYAALRPVRTNLRAAWEIELVESSMFTGQKRLDLLHWSWRAHRS